MFKSESKQQQPKTSEGRGNALYIRGEKFLVTGNGNRLQRVAQSSSGSSSTEAALRKRIDVGGVTFVANDEKGTFERTNSHLVRSYLRFYWGRIGVIFCVPDFETSFLFSHAKQKSLNILASTFKKNNIPCVIFRRLGRCLSHERGKCQKLHNPAQVAICKK